MKFGLTRVQFPLYPPEVKTKRCQLEVYRNALHLLFLRHFVVMESMGCPSSLSTSGVTGGAQGAFCVF